MKNPLKGKWICPNDKGGNTTRPKWVSAGATAKKGEYDQELPKSQITDLPMARQGNAEITSTASFFKGFEAYDNLKYIMDPSYLHCKKLNVRFHQ